MAHLKNQDNRTITLYFSRDLPWDAQDPTSRRSGLMSCPQPAAVNLIGPWADACLPLPLPSGFPACCTRGSPSIRDKSLIL